MNPRGDLRASSSSRQSSEAARVWAPIHRIALCWVCVAVLDAVVAEWRRDALDGEGASACVACGAVSHVWVTPDPRRV